MDEWRLGLGAAPGERRIDSGWRQAKAGIGLLRRDRGFATLVLISALATLAVWGGFFLFARATGPPTRGAARIFQGIVFTLVELALWSFVSLAFACAADAALDGTRLSARDAFAEAWERIRPLTGWVAISLAGWIGAVLLIEQLTHHRGYFLLLYFVWFLAFLFVLPAIAATGAGPLTAIGESLRQLRRNWAQALSGLLGIGFVFGLFAIPAGLLMSAGNRAYPTDHGKGIGLYLGGFVLFTLVFSALSAVREAFLVILLRDDLGELPGTPTGGPRPGSRRRRIALGLGIIVALFLLAQILVHRHRSVAVQVSSSTPALSTTEPVGTETFVTTITSPEAYELLTNHDVTYDGQTIGSIYEVRFVRVVGEVETVKVTYHAEGAYATKLPLSSTAIGESDGQAVLEFDGP